MGFLDQSHYDIVLVQETKLRVSSEYVTPNWICVGSGTESQKHAGVMILIRKSITNVREVRHDSIIPGRLLRVRFALGNDSCKLSVICAYQHAWNPKDPNILAKREEFWYKLSHCIGGIPYREHLVVGGDLKCSAHRHCFPTLAMARVPYPLNGPRIPMLRTQLCPHIPGCPQYVGYTRQKSAHFCVRQAPSTT